MIIRAIVFDVNGTLIDIHTDEDNERVYKSITRFLTYQGVQTHRVQVREEYRDILRRQREARGEAHPEFDAPEVWREFLARRGHRAAGSAKAELLPLFLAELFRGVSRRRLELYPGVRETLDGLRLRARLAALTDGQKAWAVPEMRAVGIDGYFDPILVSGDFGFRKPDRRLFETALSRLGVAPWEAVFVGNDMYRDVYGARQLGMKTVLFASNQGRRHWENVEPDYVIHHFGQLPEALAHLERVH